MLYGSLRLRINPKIKNPSSEGLVFNYEIKRAHSLKVRPCLEYYSLAWKNAINRIIDNTLKDYL